MIMPIWLVNWAATALCSNAVLSRSSENLQDINNPSTREYHDSLDSRRPQLRFSLHDTSLSLSIHRSDLAFQLGDSLVGLGRLSLDVLNEP